MINTPTIPTPTDLKLSDWVLAEFQSELAAGLSWLDHAFGKAQRLRKVVDGRTITFPAVYAGLEDYLRVFPDDSIGNFCFFDLEATEDLSPNGRKNFDLETDFGLVFWFDLKKIYPSDWRQRTTEHVKAAVLEVLRTLTLTRSQFRLSGINERPENIYPGFTFREIEDQFLMRPFGGFRVNGSIKFNQKSLCP